MWELYYHMRRYLAWSAFGIVVFVTPILAVTGGRAPLGPLLIPIGFGGSIFVLLRAVIGIVTGWSPGRADRATAIVIRRFFAGWLLGLIAFFCVCLTNWWLRLPGRHYFLPISMAAGGVSLVVTEWIARHKRGWLLLPLAWLVTFAAIVGGLYALARWVLP
jgi:hypothetical protein